MILPHCILEWQESAELMDKYSLVNRKVGGSNYNGEVYFYLMRDGKKWIE